MRLQQLIISNFGIYKNINTFNFPYSSDKNLSIIIGKNGSGKTTFLNALKTCLFGSMLLKNRTITKNYEKMILTKLNKDALKIPGSNFSVQATFISQFHNFDGEFTIKRSWSTTPLFKEQIEMFRNNHQLSKNEQETFLNALYHAFPLDLFDLFYLDGEKIDQLSILNSNVMNLVESSMNIDLFKKLKQDLLAYASKKVDTKEINRLTDLKNATELELISQKSNLEEAKTSLEKTTEKIASENDSLINFKNSLNLNTTEIDTSGIKDLEAKIYELQKDVESELNKFLPYTLVSKQLTSLLNAINKEHNVGKNKVVSEAIENSEFKKHLAEKIKDSNINILIKAINDFYPPSSLDLIHNLSNDEYYSLKAKLKTLLNYNKKSLYTKINTLKNLKLELKAISAESEIINIAKASGQIDELLLLQNTLNSSHETLNDFTKTIVELETIISDNDSKLKDIENDLWKQLKKSNITNVLDKTQKILNQYISEIKNKKVKEIESHTKYMFNHLIEKENFIKALDLQGDNILLIDFNDNKLTPLNLSAGEKQLFVLSLIYAIIKSSERTVPLIFDTLLGRLDISKKNNVFKNFISSCPDQVIILATDSELENIEPEYLNSVTNMIRTISYNKNKDQKSESRVLNEN